MRQGKGVGWVGERGKEREGGREGVEETCIMYLDRGAMTSFTASFRSSAFTGRLRPQARQDRGPGIRDPRDPSRSHVPHRIDCEAARLKCGHDPLVD
jgi:hypothetical protein